MPRQNYVSLLWLRDAIRGKGLFVSSNCTPVFSVQRQSRIDNSCLALFASILLRTMTADGLLTEAMIYDSAQELVKFRWSQFETLSLSRIII
jgi:hypothetical protein